MRALVIGAGEVGFDVARILAREQHDVTVVDIEADTLAHIAKRLDVMTVQGNATSAATLEEAGIRVAGMLIAVTTVDEVNIIACMMARRLGVETTVARVRSSELTNTTSVLQASDFGIDMVIHPEESAAAEAVRLINRVSATDVLTFAGNRIHLVGMRLDRESSIVGRTLRELVVEGPGVPFRIMAVTRGIRTLLPRGEERLHPGDQVFVMAQPKYIPHVAAAMGKKEIRMHDILVLGGSQVGAKVALQLSKVKNRRVKLIESSRERAVDLAEDLRNVLVIHGDPTDIDLMVREGLGEMDAFVAVTDDEESNLVTCLMAKHLGVRKTVALLSKGAYIPISQTIGLDAAVSKKLAISREVLRFLRGKHVMSVATVHGLDAEILEIEARAGSRIVRGSLMEIELPEGILIGAVQHNDRVEVATGETQVKPGDRAIVFVLPKRASDVQKYFE